MLTPDIYVTANFYLTDRNGRKLPTDAHCFRTIFVIGESKHDCRLHLDEIGSIFPGDNKKRVPIKFLFPDLVIPKIAKGTKFYLWDMRNIAEGEVEEIIAQKQN